MKKKIKQNPAGSKIARKAFNGLCAIRSGKVGAAGRLALEGKLNAH
jgi:hypothetical protein